MKIFKRIMLGVAATFAGLAILCFTAAFCMGLTPAKFEDMVFNNTFSYASVGGLLTFADPDGFVGGEHHHVSEGDYANIEIDYKQGELEIYYGDVRNIEIYNKDVRNFGYSEGEDTIWISGGTQIDIEDDFDSKLTIILPHGLKYENVILKLGASHAKIDGLLADKVVIELGAGQADITDMAADNLDVTVGAGAANFTYLAVGDMQTEVGVGQLNVQLCGEEGYYNYGIKCGIGEVVVGSKSYGGMGAKQDITNAGAVCNINIDCGIGQVCVKFTDVVIGAMECNDENCNMKWHHHNHHAKGNKNYNNHDNGHHDE